MRTCRLVLLLGGQYVLYGESQSTLTLCALVDTHLVCTGRMINAYTNYQTGHSGVAFATLAACLGGHSGPAGCSKNWMGKGKKMPILWGLPRPLWLSSQSAPANYDKMRLPGLHIECQYGVHINIACIIRSLVCCCCYDLNFTLAEYFKPTVEDIFHVFFFFFFFKKENEESMSPSQTKQ